MVEDLGKKQSALENEEEIWSKVKVKLQTAYGKDEYANWLKLLTLESINQNILTFNAPTKFMCDWIISHYGKKIVSFWREHDKSIKDLLVVVYKSEINKDTLSNKGLDKTNIESDQRSKNHLYNNLDPRFTFKDFVVGKPNELAFSACRRIAEAKDVPFNPLFLYGGVGLGKTHLMHAIAWQKRKIRPNLKILYLSAEKFMYEFIKALRFKNTVAFKDQFRSVDLLMIDDVQFISGKDNTQEEFFHTFNALIEQNRQIVISADKSPSDLDGVQERLKSRLGCGLVADIHPTTYELRLGILIEKAQKRGVEIPSKVLEFLSHRIVSNVREMEGALNRLVAHVTLVGTSITVETAQEVLHDLLKSNNKKITIEEIQKNVAEHFNIRLTDMHSPRRSRSVARPRQIAMYLAKSITSRSLPEIGRKFGGRDHTTVMHAVKKIEELKQEDNNFNDDIELLKRLIDS